MANANPQRIAPPIPFLTAVWAGMSRDDIMAGLRNGDIVRPGRLPDWASGLDDPASTEFTNTVAPVDRAQVNTWFRALDPDLQPSAFNTIWNRAGDTDGARASKLTSFLSRLLLTPGAPGDGGGANDVSRLDSYLANGGHHARIVDLSGKTGENLAALAQTDMGYRYALAHLDSFAVTGNDGLFAAANADGSLDRVDATTGEELLSESWLSDRGKFLAWKLSQDSGDPIAVAGKENWTFIDRGMKGDDGKPLKLEIRAGLPTANENQVVFGTGADEVFKGLDGSDRIYAGAGDDVLRGGRGGDHLEGGEGDDLVMGGAGNDEVIGGRGDDELDGGRGDDHLEGGSGDDTYVIDAGDGADTITDADGIGTIELNGDSLRGTLQAAEGKWTSADQNVDFAFNGDLTTGGTLTISTFAAGASHDGPAANTITVNNWKNGDLGITLGEGADGGGPPPWQDATPDSGASGVSTADLASQTWEDHDALSLDGSGNVSNGTASAAAAHPAANNGTAHVAGGAGVTETAFDFDAALDSLLGSGDQTFQAIDPTSYQQALEEFSGVLQPPDVSATGDSGNSLGVSAVTEAAMADALAADYSADAFDNAEPTHARAIPHVDVASLMELRQAGVGVRARERPDA